MNLKEYQAFAGRKCRLRVDTGLHVYCRIIDARIMLNGAPQFEVVPVAGYGSAWFPLHRVVVVADGKS